MRGLPTPEHLPRLAYIGFLLYFICAAQVAISVRRRIANRSR
jgi:hypothetical protein